MRRFNLVLTLVLFAALVLCQVQAIRVPTIPHFRVLTELPVHMVAGSTYETAFTLVTPRRAPACLNITLQITGEGFAVSLHEFFLEGTVQVWETRGRHYSVDMAFTETSGGVFQFERWSEVVSFSCVMVRVTSAPNLMPGTYTFRLALTLQYSD